MEKQILTAVSIDKETKENLKVLKENGINLSFIFRKAVKAEIEKLNKEEKTISKILERIK